MMKAKKGFQSPQIKWSTKLSNFVMNLQSTRDKNSASNILVILIKKIIDDLRCINDGIDRDKSSTEMYTFVSRW